MNFITLRKFDDAKIEENKCNQSNFKNCCVQSNITIPKKSLIKNLIKNLTYIICMYESRMGVTFDIKNKNSRV